jgi:hypothetical protein
MGRFETEWLTRPANFAALADLPGQWIDAVHQRRPPRTIVLDMDSSESPTYGEQEGSAYNGHSGAPAITRSSCSTSLAIWSAAPCGPETSIRLMAGGTCWSRWCRALSGQSEAPLFPRRRRFRHPGGLRVPRSRRHRLCDPAAGQPGLAGQDRPPPQASGRSTAAGDAPLLFQLQLPGRFMEQAATSGGQGRVAPRRALSARRRRRHQLGAAG